MFRNCLPYLCRSVDVSNGVIIGEAPPQDDKLSSASSYDGDDEKSPPKVKPAVSFVASLSCDNPISATPRNQGALKSTKDRYRTPFPTKGILSNDGNMTSPVSEGKENGSAMVQESLFDYSPSSATLALHSPSSLSSESNLRPPLTTPSMGTIDSMVTPLPLGNHDASSTSVKKIPTSVGLPPTSAAKRAAMAQMSPLFPETMNNAGEEEITPKTNNSSSSRVESSSSWDSHHGGASPTTASKILAAVSPADTVYDSAISGDDNSSK